MDISCVATVTVVKVGGQMSSSPADSAAPFSQLSDDHTPSPPLHHTVVLGGGEAGADEAPVSDEESTSDAPSGDGAGDSDISVSEVASGDGAGESDEESTSDAPSGDGAGESDEESTSEVASGDGDGEGSGGSGGGSTGPHGSTIESATTHLRALADHINPSPHTSGWNGAPVPLEAQHSPQLQPISTRHSQESACTSLHVAPAH